MFHHIVFHPFALIIKTKSKPSTAPEFHWLESQWWFGVAGWRFRWQRAAMSKWRSHWDASWKQQMRTNTKWWSNICSNLAKQNFLDRWITLMDLFQVWGGIGIVEYGLIRQTCIGITLVVCGIEAPTAHRKVSKVSDLIPLYAVLVDVLQSQQLSTILFGWLIAWVCCDMLRVFSSGLVVAFA